MMHFLTTLIALAATTTIITAIPLSDTPITTNIDTTQTNLTVEKRGWTYGWIGSHLSPNCDKKLPLAPNHKPGPYEDGHVVDPRPQLINNDEEHPEKSCREFQPVTDWIGWSYGSGNSGISTVTFYKSIADCKRNFKANVKSATYDNVHDGGCMTAADYKSAGLGAVGAYN